MDGPGNWHTKWSKSDRERQISYDSTYMGNQKKMIQANLFTKQKQTQTHRLQKQTYGYQRLTKGKEKLGVWDWHIHTTIFKTDNQQGPTIQHRELCSLFCNNLNGKRIWKRTDTCICITESLCCTAETNMTLLINYTPPKHLGRGTAPFPGWFKGTDWIKGNHVI